ncbi:Immunogenic membrane protein YajC [Candidatus Terasakiella magnetica]|uniref:Sec translocon accessory complex subunit YajC n=1 Tax=Candidatus Terasakiella magnetica TaxID=1867952 RepID=A0A1C3RCE1_9PROT|nr:preprotein translocase subunit YajC [Candidatus Terasakiella magnetica]SCA54940.1 Immunogenic membrane protein YajC [Candidatus Terasakiella magnetica]
MLISPAYAQAAGGAGGGIEAFLPLILIFVVFYFLMIRPQQKRAKEHKAMLGALRRGDNVVTSGGIMGKVTKVDSDTEVSVEIAKDTVVKVRREMIAQVTSKTEPASDEEGSSEAANDSGEKTEEPGGLKKLFGGKKD